MAAGGPRGCPGRAPLPCALPSPPLSLCFPTPPGAERLPPLALPHSELPQPGPRAGDQLSGTEPQKRRAPSKLPPRASQFRCLRLSRGERPPALPSPAQEPGSSRCPSPGAFHPGLATSRSFAETVSHSPAQPRHRPGPQEIKRQAGPCSVSQKRIKVWTREPTRALPCFTHRGGTAGCEVAMVTLTPREERAVSLSRDPSRTLQAPGRTP